MSINQKIPLVKKGGAYVFILLIAFSIYGCTSNPNHAGAQQKLKTKTIKKVPPKYPSEALINCITGHVRLQFIIQTDGSVDNILVMEAEPKHVFNRAAINAVKQWHYKPTIVNNQAIEQKAVQTLKFEQKGCASTQYKKPSELQLLFIKGYDLLSKNQPKKAIEQYFNKVIDQCEKQYNSHDTNYLSARSQLESMYYLLLGVSGNNADKNTQVIDSACSSALYHKGYSNLELGEQVIAKEYINKAIKMSPVNSMFLSELGHIYQLNRKWEKALDVFTQSEQYAENFSPPEVKLVELSRAKRGIGFSLIELGKLNQAKEKFIECLELNSQDKQALEELKYIRQALEARAQ